MHRAARGDMDAFSGGDGCKLLNKGDGCWTGEHELLK